MGKFDVGGQAILEGVMMRSPHSFAIAVRRPTGEIVVKEDAWRSIWERATFLRKPFLRGAVVLAEALHNGVKALSFSANEQARYLEPVPGDGSTGESTGKPTGAPLTSLAITGTLLVSAIFAIGLFAALPHFITWALGQALDNAALSSGTSVAFQLVDGVVKLGILLTYLWGISKMKDIARVFQYHGAEHKSIYCYEAGLPLTVENARGFTTLHPRCGTSFLIIVLGVSILIFSSVFPFLPVVSETKWLNQLFYVLVKIPLMFPVAGVAYEMTRLSARHGDHPLVKAFTWPGLMLQKITTKEPSDDQLEIALVALQKALWRERVWEAGRLVDPRAAPEVFSTYSEFQRASA